MGFSSFLVIIIPINTWISKLFQYVVLFFRNDYLKATGIQVGLLVNFKHQKANIKRMVFLRSDII
jgi:PD-(D/E)XK nuclease superfamily protein